MLSPSSQSYELVYDPFEGLFSDEDNIFDSSDEESVFDDYPVSDMWTDLEEEPCDSDEEHGEDDERMIQAGRQEEGEQGQGNVDQDRNQQVMAEVQDQGVNRSSLETLQSEEVPPVAMSDQRVQTENHREMTNENNEVLSSNGSNDQGNQASDHVDHRQTTNLPQANKPPHYGYTLTIDNIDMNIRRSFQRFDRTTQSFHFCHVYAALNRLDSAMLEDGNSSSVPSVETVLPTKDDLEKVLADFNILVSRYSLLHCVMMLNN